MRETPIAKNDWNCSIRSIREISCRFPDPSVTTQGGYGVDLKFNGPKVARECSGKFVVGDSDELARGRKAFKVAIDEH